MLTACIGIPVDNGAYSEVQIDPPVPLTGKTRLLLCSDGLSDMVPDDRIEQILRSEQSVDKAVKVLMSEALNNGGRDNITIIAADI